MNYIERVKLDNPIAYTIMENSIRNNKLGHAYIFDANVGQQIENEYLYFVQRLISSDELRNPMAYTDLTIIDGSEGLIKKEMVISAIERLQQTALDASGKKFLVIKNIENSNKQSINSLLKFIEEPTDDTYILMTTNSLTSVLSTIKSRSQIIKIKDKTVEKLMEEIVEAGVDEKSSRILANISTTAEEAKEIFDDNFEQLRASIIEAFDRAITNNSAIITELQPLIKKTNYKLSLNIIKEFLSDIWREQELMPLSNPDSKALIQKYILANYDFSKAIESVNDFIVKRGFYVNFDLYKNKLLIEMEECYE